MISYSLQRQILLGMYLIGDVYSLQKKFLKQMKSMKWFSFTSSFSYKHKDYAAYLASSSDEDVSDELPIEDKRRNIRLALGLNPDKEDEEDNDQVNYEDAPDIEEEAGNEEREEYGEDQDDDDKEEEVVG